MVVPVTPAVLDRVRGALWGAKNAATTSLNINCGQILTLWSPPFTAAALGTRTYPSPLPSPRPTPPTQHTGIYIADSLSMPVHWYYDVRALQRDYGRITGYQAPRERHPSSIMALSSTSGHGRGGQEGPRIIGDIINHGKHDRWGKQVRCGAVRRGAARAMHWASSMLRAWG